VVEKLSLTIELPLSHFHHQQIVGQISNIDQHLQTASGHVTFMLNSLQSRQKISLSDSTKLPERRVVIEGGSVKTVSCDGEHEMEIPYWDISSWKYLSEAFNLLHGLSAQ
jgi:hypothetical protein